MKRWALVATFLLFLLLCASIAYWGMQMFKPPLRPVAAPAQAANTEVRPEAAAALFGGRAGKVAVASNYQLHGVIMSGTAQDSVAILSADGKPAKAVGVGIELQPGVVVKEVHREYALLSEGGAIKRVELPQNAPQGGQMSYAAAPTSARPMPPRAVPPLPAQTPQPQARMPAPAVSVNPNVVPGAQPNAAAGAPVVANPLPAQQPVQQPAPAAAPAPGMVPAQPAATAPAATAPAAPAGVAPGTPTGRGMFSHGNPPGQ